jgi:hypothetical protein
LRRNVEHSPDQPLPATFGIPAMSPVDFDRHSNICLRVSQQSFPTVGTDAALAVLQPSPAQAQWRSRPPADFEECADAAEKAAATQLPNTGLL